MDRIQQQHKPVAAYQPYYLGMPDGSLTDVQWAKDHVDGEGYDVDGNTAGVWCVWNSFIAFQREFPRATFDNNGNIWI